MLGAPCPCESTGQLPPCLDFELHGLGNSKTIRCSDPNLCFVGVTRVRDLAPRPSQSSSRKEACGIRSMLSESYLLSVPLLSLAQAPCKQSSGLTCIFLDILSRSKRIFRSQSTSPVPDSSSFRSSSVDLAYYWWNMIYKRLVLNINRSKGFELQSVCACGAENIRSSNEAV
jgi:hypothetical protein